MGEPVDHEELTLTAAVHAAMVDRALTQDPAEAFGREEGGELWLVGMHVPPYAMSGSDAMGHDPDRPRKLLLHRREIRRITERMALEGLTLVPLRLYFSGGNAKVEVALGRGRKLHDKRQALARKEADREAARAMGTDRRR